MVSFREFDETKMVEYTTDELRGFLNEIEMRRGVVADRCAGEMAACFKDDKFDMYSFRGSRKLKKIVKKHNPLFEAADEFERIISTELRKREQYEEELRYSGKGIIKPKKYESEEEFLQKEQDKTDVYRSKLN